LPGRLLTALALQVAKHDRRAVVGRQTIDLLVEGGEQFGRETWFGFIRSNDREIAFDNPSADLNRPYPCGRPARYAMQPGPQRLANPERPTLVHENEKRRLEGVVRIVFVVQYPPARPQDHRPVAMEQRRERLLRHVTAVVPKPFQQLGVV
jgi:hypothetical protein